MNEDLGQELDNLHQVRHLQDNFEAAMTADDMEAALEINDKIVRLVLSGAMRTNLKRQWAGRRGLTQSRAWPTNDPVAWLSGRRSRAIVRPSWFDHGTCWMKDGSPYCLVGQPYGLTSAGIAELAELQEQGFSVLVATYPAWHYRGSVLHIEVTTEA